MINSDADLEGDDVILCQITSQAKSDPYAVAVDSNDFSSGSLSMSSYVRANKIFTADKKFFLYAAGQLSETKTSEIVDSVISILKK